MRTRVISIVESILIAATLLGAVLSAWVAATGGARFSLFNIDMRATDPYRPLAIAIGALVLRIAIGGRNSVRGDIVRIRA